MKYQVQLGRGAEKKTRVVEFEGDENARRISLDGNLIEVDAVETAANTFSILLGGNAYEIRVRQEPDGTLALQSGFEEFAAEIVDPRAWSGRRHGAGEVEGRQQVVAPMPGKVVRILVAAGERVEAGQGLIVVEAMKMQNEVRSPKSGVVEMLAVQEGQAVNAGEVLCVVA